MHLGTTIDGLYRLKCPVSLETSYQDHVTFHQAADGSQSATIFGGLVGNRTWTVGYSLMTPRDAMFLSSFTDHKFWYDRGKVCFIPTAGERTNMLTREESGLSLVPGFMKNPVVTEDGPVFGYVESDEVVRIADQLPLPASGERRLCLSFYADGPVLSRVEYWRGGSNVVNFVLDHPATKSWRREHTVYPAVSEARFVKVFMRGRFTAPAITLGEHLYEYGTGTRVGSVLVTPAGDTMQSARSRGFTHQSYSKRSFTITELRNSYEVR